MALATRKSLYANIGSGAVGLSYGWVNIDFSPAVNVHYVFDCSKELPFATNSVKGLFTEHFFEHLDFNDEVPEFLKEVYRVLEPNGCVRIIVPDAEKYLLGYCSHDWELLKQTRPLDDDLNDLIMGYRYNTKMELINEVFRQGGQHKYAWDFLTMEHVLKRAGFSMVIKQSYMSTYDKTLAIDMEARRHESLYVEAIKCQDFIV
ncbi:methyltransferase domain-containing protein [Flavihumibacter sp. R14]|nr:methyltransferase domain-containing protein [Flavihumibacter soli]